MIQVDLLLVLKQLLASYNVEIKFVKKPYDDLNYFDYGLTDNLSSSFDRSKIIKLFTDSLTMNTMTILEDFLGVKYIIFPYPDNLDSFFIIGPYRYESYDTFETKEWYKDDLGESLVNNLRNYYLSIPFVYEELINSHVVSIVSTIYPKNKFTVKHITEFTPFNVIPSSLSSDFNKKNDKSMEMIENLYEIENKALDAIAAGNATLALQYLRSYRSPNIEERFYKSLRTKKNSLIIFNSLMRKAIEKAQVHPYYIDEISSKYATKIELLADDKEYHQLMQVMVTDYCDYVHKYSLNKYTNIIQKVIHHINLNIDSDLSLTHLANLTNINASYLSNLFKNETGSTISDYINSQRINVATHLLKDTHLSIADIAQNVGISDMNYFSRLFKKYTGMTPTQFRKTSFIK